MEKLFAICLSALLLGGCCGRTVPADGEVLVVPKPESVVRGEGVFRLTASTRAAAVFDDGRIDYALEALDRMLIPLFGRGAERAGELSDHAVNFIACEGMAPEAYELSVRPDRVEIRASDAAGAFYAVQTLRQLLPAAVGECAGAGAVELSEVTIVDKPCLGYRGMMLDAGRHFFAKEDVMTLLDAMALHKLNVFHWHLTDDQGWRIEIERYPELTRIGSVRRRTIVGRDPGGEYDETTQYDETPYGGYYTQEDIREVVDYAARRFITVIPEIEFPGHAVGALASYPWLSCTGERYEVRQTWDIDDRVFCIGRETTFEFIENVLEEVVKLFPSEYIHIGGDECPSKFWEKCPACRARMRAEGLSRPRQLQGYATARVEQFLQRHGRRLVGWDEILDGGVTPTAVVMSWRGTEGGIRAAKQGNSVIMSPTTYCYLDYYQTSDTVGEPLAIGGCLPLEKVYSLDPFEGLDAAESRYILGVQGNLWTEYIGDLGYAQYMLLPRLSALAEVGWSSDRKDYADYLHRLGRLRRIYDDEGYAYGKHAFDNQ